jgi:hypothetical protein
MPVLAKFNGIVLRMLVDPTFGIRVHAFYGDSELIVGLDPRRLIMSEVPAWVEAWVLDWVKQHEGELRPLVGRAARSAFAASQLAA